MFLKYWRKCKQGGQNKTNFWCFFPQSIAEYLYLVSCVEKASAHMAAWVLPERWFMRRNIFQKTVFKRLGGKTGHINTFWIVSLPSQHLDWPSHSLRMYLTPAPM